MQSTDIEPPRTSAAPVPPLPALDRLPRLRQIVTLIVVVVPFAGLIAAMVMVWGHGFDWLNLALLLGMYVTTGLGVTMGYHRFFAHRSYETGRAMQAVLAVLGSMSVEGSLLQWVSTHRCHHHHSDEDEDPHSPNQHGAGFLNMARGLWRAHVGWLFEPVPQGLRRYVADLRADRLYRTIDVLFPLWVGLGLVIPGAVGGAIGGSWSAVLLAVLWGGVVRICLVHHLTWSINSVCHIWGTQPFLTHDQSRNNLIFGVLGFGEGWHNNHHAFPTSARHGLRWWELDVSYMVIRVLSLVGLTWNVRLPSPERVAAKAR